MRALFLVLMLAGLAHAESRLTISISPDQQQALGIRTGVVQPVERAWSVSYPGQVIVPNAQLRVVSAPQAGLLEALLVAEGEAVELNQPLALIRSPQLLEQQRDYLEALGQLKTARTTLERDRQLHDEGIIAERRFLESRAHYLQAQTVADQRRQTLALAGMSETALRNLEVKRSLSDALTVRAPLAGVVLEQIATPGQRLDALDPVYRVGKLSPLWLEIHVPIDRAGQIKPGTEVRLSESSLTGRVITVGQMVHGADQGVMVRAEITVGTELLRPGQFVQVALAEVTHDGRVWRVPRGALVRQGGQIWVFAARKGGFDSVAVDIVSEETASIIIRAPLHEGSQVVVAGTAAIKAAWLERAE